MAVFSGSDGLPSPPTETGHGATSRTSRCRSRWAVIPLRCREVLSKAPLSQGLGDLAGQLRSRVEHEVGVSRTYRLIRLPGREGMIVVQAVCPPPDEDQLVEPRSNGGNQAVQIVSSVHGRYSADKSGANTFRQMRSACSLPRVGFEETSSHVWMMSVDGRRPG